jgi:hypothetical protein
LDEFQIEFSQQRAGSQGMFVLVTIIYRIETFPCERTRQPFLNAFDIKASKPIVGIAPLFSLFVNIRRGSSSRRFWTLSSRHFLIGPNKLEDILIMHNCYNGIERCAFKGFVARTKSLKRVIVTRVKGMKEEHDHENRGKYDIATRHIVNHTIKA